MLTGKKSQAVSSHSEVDPCFVLGDLMLLMAIGWHWSYFSWAWGLFQWPNIWREMKLIALLGWCWWKLTDAMSDFNKLLDPFESRGPAGCFTGAWWVGQSILMRLWKGPWVCCQRILCLPGLFLSLWMRQICVCSILDFHIYKLFREISHLDSSSQAIPG